MTEIHNFIIRISIKSVSVFKIKQFVKNVVRIKMYCNDTFNTLILLCVKYDNIFRSTESAVIRSAALYALWATLQNIGNLIQ